MSKFFAKVASSEILTTLDLRSQLSDRFDYVYYPAAESVGCDDWYGFTFAYTGCRLLSWEMISKWCSLSAYPDDRDNCIETSTEGEALPAAEVFERSCEHGFPCSVQVWLRTLGKAATSFSISVDANQYSLPSLEAPPLELRIDTGLRVKATQFPKIAEFWESLKVLSSFRNAEVVTNESEDGHPLLKPQDDSSYHWIPRHMPDHSGIVIKSEQPEDASTILCELQMFLQNMPSRVAVEFIRTGFDLTDENFDQVVQTMHCVSPSWHFSFTGRYHEDFSIEQVEGFPQDGYWRFPLMGTELDDIESIQMDFVKTPTEEFVELWGPCKEALLEYVESTSFEDRLEFWQGPEHERWGLHLLART